MSRSTPRMSRLRHQPSGGSPRATPASDYESDAAHYMENRKEPSQPQVHHRTNTDLNVAVLRRYVANIRSILSVAANAVVYSFSPAEQNWEKHGVEGTMFVCEQEPGSMKNFGASQFCVFVLNRRGLENFVVNLGSVKDHELAEGLLIFRLDDGTGALHERVEGEQEHVIGIWIHADEQDTRDTNAKIIQAAWRQSRAASVSHTGSFLPVIPPNTGFGDREAGLATATASVIMSVVTATAGTASSETFATTTTTTMTTTTSTTTARTMDAPAGRRLSISDLFRRQGGQ